MPACPCQVSGRKQLLLFPPGQTYNLYPYPASHPMHAFAMVDVESPDTRTFPSFSRAAGIEAILEPGDALWLPSFYWHYVKQIAGDETISLNFWIGAKNSARAEQVRLTSPHANPNL
jgi:hypoxia-inducible factor 1-alpha inhibitor (HIF hydroxylase)